MKRVLFLLYLAAAMAAWCSASFAQQACIAGCNLSPLGVTNGVTMTGGGTLTVGTVGGPQMDIFTNNSSGGVISNPALFAITTDASSTHSIVFNSSSNVFGIVAGTAGQIFLNISGGNAGTAVNFNGAVQATTTFVTGTGTINFNSGSSNSTAMIFNADGAIGLAPNTTVIGALTTAAGAQTGTLSLASASVLNGAVGGAVGLRAINVVGGSNLAGISATITGATNAFTYSLATNRLNVGGALTIANAGAGGVINTTLASTTVFGNIRPTGQVNFGPTTTVNVLVPAGAFIPNGSLFNIVQGASQNVSSVITVLDPTNPLFKFAAVPAGGTLTGLVTIQLLSSPLLVPVAPPAGVVLPPTSVIAGPAVTALLGTPLTPDIITVLGAISALTDPAAVVNAVAQLAPSRSDLAAPLVTFQGSRMFQDLWSSRLDDVLCGEVNQRDCLDGDVSTCRGNDPHNGWWLKGFGQFGSQGTQGAYSGYDLQIYGTMVGLDAPVGDAPIGEDTRVGLGIGYARSIINGRTFSTNTDFDTAQVTAYVGHERGPWFVQGDLSAGWNDYSGKRNIAFPGFSRSARAAYTGQDYTSFMSTGFHFAADRFTITPLASLQYTHVSLGNYGETGAGDIDLRVRGQEYDFLEFGLGVKVAHPFGFHDGFANRDATVVPEVHVKWLRELYNPTMMNVAAFAPAGSPLFAAPGIKAAPDTFNIGTGITLLSCACSAKTWSLEAVYDYDRRTDNYDAHQVMMKFSSRF